MRGTAAAGGGQETPSCGNRTRNMAPCPQWLIPSGELVMSQFQPFFDYLHEQSCAERAVNDARQRELRAAKERERIRYAETMRRTIEHFAKN